VEVSAWIEVATVKQDRRGNDGLLLGLRCEPHPTGLKADGLVWERFGLDDPRWIERAVHFAGRFGVECQAEDLTLDAIGPVLAALRDAPARPLRVANKLWSNGQGSSWQVTGFVLTPTERQAFAGRWRDTIKTLPPLKRSTAAPKPAAVQSDDDLPF